MVLKKSGNAPQAQRGRPSHLKAVPRPTRATEERPKAENHDLFLSEEALIGLAMQHLDGRLPPGFDPYARLRERSAPSRTYGPQAGFELPPPPPGRRTLLARELEARGWTPGDLAEHSGLSRSEAAALTKGTTRITREAARILSQVFATSEEFWLE